MKFILLGLRVGQIVCASVVLGLAVTLLKGQIVGDDKPSQLTFAAFTGGFGILFGIACAAAAYIEFLSDFVVMGVDALAAIFFLTGGTIIAVKLQGISCTSNDIINAIKESTNELLNGGCVKINDNARFCGYTYTHDKSTLDARCKQSQATSAFSYISMVVLLVILVLSFLHHKKR